MNVIELVEDYFKSQTFFFFGMKKRVLNVREIVL